MNGNERVGLQYAAGDERNCHHLAMDCCSDSMTYEMNGVELEPQGRMIELTLLLRDVCPGKRTALGVTLHERDEDGTEHPRGMRTMTVPAHDEPCRSDILVRHIRFVLPGDEDFGRDGCRRELIARVTAHYVDIDAGSACACRG